jgi:hypothetical protein
LQEGACLIAAVGDAISLRQQMQEVMSVKFNPQWRDELRERVAPEVIARQILQVFSQG